MTDKEKIRDLKSYCESQLSPKAACGDIINLTRQDVFAEILDLVDRIEQGICEEEPVSEDLEEAAEKYGDELNNILITAIDDDTSFGEYAQEAFKAGAQWQKRKDIEKTLSWLDYHCDAEERESYKEYMEED